MKKHSGASKGEVRLEMAGQSLHLRIRDEGVGFNVKERSANGGIGIRSMEERSRLQGGWFEIESEHRKGTTVNAWFPLGERALT